MKEKIKILCYECKKCGKLMYFRSNEEYTTQCKTCKNEMQFIWEHNYNSNGGLSAIKNSNLNNKTNKNNIEKNVPKCPTCQSTNLKKITVTSKAMNTALFGLFGTKRHKTFHCNNCGYEW